MKVCDFISVILTLQKESRKWKPPVTVLEGIVTRDPFRILISTLLSLRTKDEVTAGAFQRLIQEASTPEALSRIPVKTIQKLIYPVGFYRVKSKNIQNICRILVEKYQSRVPDSLEELLVLKGIGRKTANLVLALGYQKKAICVDTHVHRICNRLGIIKTKNPFETEMALMKKLPKNYWNQINSLLVAFGQTLCRPVGPRCSQCPVSQKCAYFF
jgi:endonuclease III